MASNKRMNISIPDQAHDLAKDKAQKLYGGNLSRLMTDALLFYLGALERKEPGKNIKDLFPDACFGIDPDCMMDQYQAFLDAYIDRMLFASNSLDLRRVKEVWQAASFGRILKQKGHEIYVQMIPAETDVDIMLYVDGNKFPFQLTEVLDPERTRSLEYATIYKNPTPCKRMGESDKKFEMRGHDWLEKVGQPYRPGHGAEMAPAWIAEGVKRKAKRYGSKGPHLIIFASFSANQIDLEKVKKVCGEALKAFPSVWVFWRKAVGLLSPENMWSFKAGEWFEPKQGD